MRWRIQIDPLLGCTLCVVTEIDDWHNTRTHKTKLYTLDGDDGAHGGLVEMLGELQRMIGESTP